MSMGNSIDRKASWIDMQPCFGSREKHCMLKVHTR
jgi:hypothetical protein